MHTINYLENTTPLDYLDKTCSPKANSTNKIYLNT